MENEKNVKKTSEDYLDPLTKKFKEGNPGGGRLKGSTDFKTDFDKVVKQVAKEEGITKGEARRKLLRVAYENAKKGHFSFYKDTIDRYYGTEVQKHEVIFPKPIYSGKSIENE